MALWLFVGAIPAAFLGSFLSSVISAQGLEFFIAVLIIFVGGNAVMTGGQLIENQRNLEKTTLVGLGTITGIGSALSGTGGPLILVPILVWLKVPVLTAVGLSQAVLLPVAALATTGNFIFGSVDIIIGSTLALALMIGASIGARIAHSVSGTTLKKVVAWVLVAVGFLMVLRLARDWFGI